MSLLKHEWFHLKSYSVFRDLNWRSIGNDLLEVKPGSLNSLNSAAGSNY